MVCVLLLACDDPAPDRPEPVTPGKIDTPTTSVSVSSTTPIASSPPQRAKPRPSHRGGVPRASDGCDAGDVAICQNACQKAAGPDCYWLARRHVSGDGVDQNMDTALRLYTRSCDGGVARGCYHAGRIHDDRKQRVQAERLLKRACAGGDYLGCKYAQSYQEPEH